MVCRFRIYFRTKRLDYIREIRRKFRINCISVNGESYVELEEQDAELLRECERRGFIAVRGVEIVKP